MDSILIRTRYYAVVGFVAVMTTGCGGGSGGSSATQATSSAPTRAFFYDADGTQVSRMQFQYPDELTINVQLESVGLDKVWGTEDDASHSYLQCQYMSAPTPLLRYPDGYFFGMAGSPTGATALAILGLSNNGPMKCPVRSGRRLQQESGYLANLHTSSQDNGYRYLIEAELEHHGSTAIEVVDYKFTDLDVTVADILALTEFTTPVDLSTVDEPDLQAIVDHTQTNTVIFDAEQRPLSIDLVADSSWTAVLDEYCMSADPLAVSIKLLRGCSSAHQTRSYRYLDDSVEQDTQRYKGSTSGDLVSYTSNLLADRVMIHPGTSDDGLFSGTYYDSYPLNELGQVTARVQSLSGEDGVWGTGDDQERSLETYHYDGNDRISEVSYFGSIVRRYAYYNDGKLKQVDEFDGLSDLPMRRTQISYRQGVPAKITVQWRAGEDELQTRIVMEFAPSEEEWPQLFTAISLFPEFLTPPSIGELMHFKRIR